MVINLSNLKRYSVAELAKYKCNFDDIDWDKKTVPRDFRVMDKVHVNVKPDCGFDTPFTGTISDVKRRTRNGVVKSEYFVLGDDGAEYRNIAWDQLDLIK